ncbi:MAG: PEGA domain-containing protein [Hamadaea sp.]|uniref:carboxypeptidase regulatory-like domain-containing protein n=1 Tax=Hamadaea sp. TaxID=2024425 RepID=UPI0017CFA8A5|nr:carboxypeptidase regulatory-like domain-containing protein [Hamadaea sp.]NUT23560.1 PEGA domain-containing protein [Hamadaea sp.]
MSRSLLRGLGAMTAAIVAAVALGSPAYAEDTGTISGTITDAGGVVVEGAIVGVESTDESYSGYAATDAAGHYSVSGIPAGASYRVWTRAGGHPQQYAHGKISADQADLFPVTAGGVTTVDEAFLAVGRIQGKFVDAAGVGIGNVGVEASNDTGATSSVTGFDGSYSIDVLAGTYRVSFWRNGLAQWAYGTYNVAEATLFTVGQGATVTVDDTALPSGSIAGTVTYADGSPAADVSVDLNGGPSYGYTQTDASGAYRIDGLAPGGYLVSVRLPSGATEWVPGKLSQDEGTKFTVVGDAVTTVNERLPGIGRLAGHFTAADGSPMGGLSVSAADVNGWSLAYGTTSDDGTYAIDQVFVGDYRVAFESWETGFQQWAYGKTNPADADVITVTAGQTTTVDDSRLPAGTVRITAKDASTGTPLSQFEAYLNDGFKGAGTSTGELVMSDVPTGTYQVTVTAEGYIFSPKAATVTVTAGQQAEVSVTLRPMAKISTTVVDRATGQPVADVCVFPETKLNFVITDGCVRSGNDGKVDAYVNPGEYELFALPPRGSAYGAQWVGPNGGTGVQTDAAILTATEGQAVAAPAIKLDRAGTITGTVTSSTGAVQTQGYVGIVQPDFGSGADIRYTPISSNGVYTVDYLGPYKWPLYFTAAGHANQWSGGTGNRRLADLVKVRPGQTTTYDYRLKQGTKVTITWSGTGGGRFLARNAVTGDIVGIRDGSSGTPVIAELFVIGPQRVKLQCYCGAEASPLWHGGTDFATADVVIIPDPGPYAIEFRQG